MSGRRAVAFNAFLTDAKMVWMSELFPALRAEYDALRADRPVSTAEEAGAVLSDSPLYMNFAWLERHIQKAKYSGRWGLAATAEAKRLQLEAELERADAELQPALDIPEYYTRIDIHQHPGNLVGDSLAGYVYRGSAMSTQPGQTTGLQLHRRFAEVVAEEGSFTRIADLACGFGKSTIPLAQRFPATVVVGMDLSAPCLRLAAVEAQRNQVHNVCFRQRDACHTGEPPGGYDLVTSTMLLHELPPESVADALRESWRLLAPGGLSIHLDFRAEDPFLAFILAGHGRRNNEPYMDAFNRLDVAELHRSCGFTEFRVQPFAESDAAAGPNWRFPWTVFAARKPPVSAA